ncbi:MAG TPA: VOC family protein [Actinocrinis sp.]|jgi:predicted enzyme related to lactoylglutathione lyase
MSTRLHAIVVDALDPEAQARFWAEALRWQPARSAGTVVTGTRAAVVRPDRPGGLELRFAAASGPKAAKNRLHLDLAPGPDQARQVDRLLALGAEHCDIGQGEVPWVVLADPEGNEFCVLAEVHGAEQERTEGLAAVCLDADDPAVQSRFWADATGWPVVQRAAWGVRLRAADGGPSLVMGPPATGKQDTNRLRPLLAPGPGGTVRAEAERMRAAGAVQLDGMLVDPVVADSMLADPEGNEFHITEP